VTFWSRLNAVLPFPSPIWLLLFQSSDSKERPLLIFK